MPLSKFHDAWDYYKHMSSMIEGIKAPHLTLHSDDDPMVGTYNILQKEIEQHSHVVMASMYMGGHVAWFMGKERRWFMQPTKEWVLVLLDVR